MKTNKLISQQISQLIKYLVSQSLNQSIGYLNKPDTQSINLTSQLVSQSIIQSVNQSVNQSINQANFFTKTGSSISFETIVTYTTTLITSCVAIATNSTAGSVG